MPFNNQPLCVIANAVCPETADPTKRRYCPAWVDQAPETEPDGRGAFTGTVYRGCGFRRYMQWIQVNAAQTGRHTATVDTYRREQEEELGGLRGEVRAAAQMVAAGGLAVLAGAGRQLAIGPPLDGKLLPAENETPEAHQEVEL